MQLCARIESINHKPPLPKSIPNTSSFQREELSSGRSVVCGTIVLDQTSSPDPLVNRIANRIYEDCRAEKLKVPGFPDFGPVINALRDGNQPGQERAWKVCCAQQGRLMILESLAAKWLETDSTSERAEEAVTSHNSKYNAGGDKLAADRTLLKPCLLELHYIAIVGRNPRTVTAEEPPSKRLKTMDAKQASSEDVSRLQGVHRG